MGVLSRDGWALLDDSETPRLDGAGTRGGWEWAVPTEAPVDAPAGTKPDTDGRCGEWAGSGECERNRGFMESSCAMSCGRLAARRAQKARGEGRLDWYLFARGLDFKGAVRTALIQ